MRLGPRLIALQQRGVMSELSTSPHDVTPVKAASNQPLDDHPTRAASSTEPSAAPNFPEIARLDLDDLLTQLIDRAQEVMSTQSRLRGLLTATQAISMDLSLPV